MEIAPAINAPVGSLLLIGWSGFDQTESPPLELIGVLFRQRGGIREAGRFADDFKFDNPYRRNPPSGNG